MCILQFILPVVLSLEPSAPWRLQLVGPISILSGTSDFEIRLVGEPVSANAYCLLLKISSLKYERLRFVLLLTVTCSLLLGDFSFSSPFLTLFVPGARWV